MATRTVTTGTGSPGLSSDGSAFGGGGALANGDDLVIPNGKAIYLDQSFEVQSGKSLTLDGGGVLYIGGPGGAGDPGNPGNQGVPEGDGAAGDAGAGGSTGTTGTITVKSGGTLTHNGIISTTPGGMGGDGGNGGDGGFDPDSGPGGAGGNGGAGGTGGTGNLIFEAGCTYANSTGAFTTGEMAYSQGNNGNTGTANDGGGGAGGQGGATGTDGTLSIQTPANDSLWLDNDLFAAGSLGNGTIQGVTRLNLTRSTDVASTLDYVQINSALVFRLTGAANASNLTLSSIIKLVSDTTGSYSNVDLPASISVNGRLILSSCSCQSPTTAVEWTGDFDGTSIGITSGAFEFDDGVMVVAAGAGMSGAGGVTSNPTG